MSQALSLLSDLEQRCATKECNNGGGQTKKALVLGDLHPLLDDVHGSGLAAHAAHASHEVNNRTSSAVRKAVAEMLPHVSADDSLLDAGLDSIGAVELFDRLNGSLSTESSLSPTLIFDYPTVRLLEEHLNSVVDDHERASRSVEQGDSSLRNIDCDRMLSDDDDDGDDGDGADDEHDYDEDDVDED